MGNASEAEFKDCIGHVFAQLDATDMQPCTSGSGAKEGKDCALRDLMVGKARGYVSGWNFSVKQIITTYLKAYKFGSHSDCISFQSAI
jgi:hypothetical protein